MTDEEFKSWIRKVCGGMGEASGRVASCLKTHQTTQEIIDFIADIIAVAT
jgi:hypothetical protein